MSRRAVRPRGKTPYAMLDLDHVLTRLFVPEYSNAVNEDHSCMSETVSAIYSVSFYASCDQVRPPSHGTVKVENLAWKNIERI